VLDENEDQLQGCNPELPSRVTGRFKEVEYAAAKFECLYRYLVAYWHKTIPIP